MTNAATAATIAMSRHSGRLVRALRSGRFRPREILTGSDLRRGESSRSSPVSRARARSALARACASSTSRTAASDFSRSTSPRKRRISTLFRVATSSSRDPRTGAGSGAAGGVCSASEAAYCARHDSSAAVSRASSSICQVLRASPNAASFCSRKRSASTSFAWRASASFASRSAIAVRASASSSPTR